MGVAFTVVALALVLTNMAVRMRGASWSAFILKTVCGVLFCVLGVAGYLHVRSLGSDQMALGILIMTGLAMGLLGDVSLALKDLVKPRYDRFLLGGFLLFAAGHVAYIAALIIGWETPFPWVPIFICAGLAIGFVICDRVLRLNFGRFKWVVAAYGVLLMMLPAMGFFTMATGSTASPQPGIMAAAGVSFLISDLVLAWTYFGRGQDRPWEHVLCYVFYYAAQFGIAAALFII